MPFTLSYLLFCSLRPDNLEALNSFWNKDSLPALTHL